MYSFRLAEERDIPELSRLDPMAESDEPRRKFITRAVLGHNCYVAIDERIVAYGVLEYSFFEQGLISLVLVRPEARRRGAGSALVKYFESICTTPKLFTSTNLSNLPMQAVLEKLGYKLSGVIQYLDEGDPEMVYVKFLRTDTTSSPRRADS